MDWLWLALLGFGTGAYGTLVGAGGGFILGPALLIFFDMEPQVVAGTALAAVAIWYNLDARCSRLPPLS